MSTKAECSWLDCDFCTRLASAQKVLQKKRQSEETVSIKLPEWLSGINIEELEIMANKLPSMAQEDEEGRLTCKVSSKPELQKSCSGYISTR